VLEVVVSSGRRISELTVCSTIGPKSLDLTKGRLQLFSFDLRNSFAAHGTRAETYAIDL